MSKATTCNQAPAEESKWMGKPVKWSGGQAVGGRYNTWQTNLVVQSEESGCPPFNQFEQVRDATIG